MKLVGNNVIRIIRAAAAAAVLALAALSLPVAAQSPGQLWELKGFHLGMSMEDAKAAIPNGKCEVKAPGVELCEDRNMPFAGGTTRLVVKFLDSRVVSISANDITREQAQNAALGLISKFGPATNVNTDTRYVQRLDRQVSAKVYQWRDGDVALVVTPFKFSDGRKDIFAQVLLSQLSVHDEQWLRRARGQASNAVATDI